MLKELHGQFWLVRQEPFQIGVVDEADCGVHHGLGNPCVYPPTKVVRNAEHLARESNSNQDRPPLLVAAFVTALEHEARFRKGDKRIGFGSRT